jgi:hypothetical protein
MTEIEKREWAIKVIARNVRHWREKIKPKEGLAMMMAPKPEILPDRTRQNSNPPERETSKTEH